MKLKQKPEHFQVEELLREGPAASGPYALYRLTKTDMTTPEAASALARELRVPPGCVSYAGLKDRHAETVQHMAAKGGPARAAGGNRWRAEFVGFRAGPLDGRDILANRFGVVLNAMTDEALARIEARRGTLDRFGLVDYFGDQRFGSARHGRGFVAAEFVRGRQDEALKLAIATEARKDTKAVKVFRRHVADRWGRWEECLAGLPRHPDRAAVEHLARGRPRDYLGAFARLPYSFQQFCVMAYQSHLWNETARGMLEAALPPDRLLRAGSAAGEMVFPAPSAAIPDSLRPETPVPLLARKTVLQGPAGDAAARVLEREGIALANLRLGRLRRPFFGAGERPLAVPVRDFSVSPPQPDPASSGRWTVKLRFLLPPGSYATVLVRMLVQAE